MRLEAAHILPLLPCDILVDSVEGWTIAATVTATLCARVGHCDVTTHIDGSKHEFTIMSDCTASLKRAQTRAEIARPNFHLFCINQIVLNMHPLAPATFLRVSVMLFWTSHFSSQFHCSHSAAPLPVLLRVLPLAVRLPTLLLYSSALPLSRALAPASPLLLSALRPLPLCSMSADSSSESSMAPSFLIRLKRSLGRQFQLYLDWSVPHITARSDQHATRTGGQSVRQRSVAERIHAAESIEAGAHRAVTTSKLSSAQYRSSHRALNRWSLCRNPDQRQTEERGRQHSDRRLMQQSRCGQSSK